MSVPPGTPSTPSTPDSAIADLDDLASTKRPVLSIREVAAILGVDRRVVSRAVAERQIPAVRLGERWFVPRSALASLLAAGDEAA